MLKASLLSQLGNLDCEAEDTEEMFWLRQSDDYQSKIDLGNKLAAQYRFKEAASVYSDALKIKNDELLTYQRIAGCYLTLRQFDKAILNYNKCVELNGSVKPVAFTIGIYHYLKGNYEEAKSYFIKALPCDDELKIAVIYWHTICSFRTNTMPVLLEDYDINMDVGHHKAYKISVDLFKGNLKEDSAVSMIMDNKDSLDYVIIAYGIACYYEKNGEENKKEALINELLLHDNFWPSISYLAAWGDKNG